MQHFIYSLPLAICNYSVVSSSEKPTPILQFNLIHFFRKKTFNSFNSTNHFFKTFFVKTPYLFTDFHILNTFVESIEKTNVTLFSQALRSAVLLIPSGTHMLSRNKVSALDCFYCSGIWTSIAGDFSVFFVLFSDVS